MVYMKKMTKKYVYYPCITNKTIRYFYSSLSS